jgi:hypothetical protein
MGCLGCSPGCTAGASASACRATCPAHRNSAHPAEQVATQNRLENWSGPQAGTEQIVHWLNNVLHPAPPAFLQITRPTCSLADCTGYCKKTARCTPDCASAYLACAEQYKIKVHCDSNPVPFAVLPGLSKARNDYRKNREEEQVENTSLAKQVHLSYEYFDIWSDIAETCDRH